MVRLARAAILMSCFLVASSALATTYYIDYTGGKDSNNGTSKTSPWKNAPGMNGCLNNCNSATINPGDSVILKGCVTWPNSALPWAWNFNGSSSAQIYIGVDQTWWDSTVSGCSTVWNRPVLNGQRASTNRGNGREDIVTLWKQYTTFDNIEITGALGNPTGNSTDIIDLLGGGGSTGSEGVIISNVYIHGWVNPYFCYGTGNVAANSSTITNFVPSYCNANFPTNYASVNASVQIYPQGSYWPVQSNGPVVTAISGSNPYSISTTSTTVGNSCMGCYVIVGLDAEKIISGNEGGNSGAMVVNSVIDGSDTAEVVNLNPYGDCGLTESNNKLCIGSGTAEWRGPQIWRNNVIRFVESVAVGACTEWSGNLIEYIRTSIDPTGHTNGIECVDDFPVNNTTLFYNNVFRHSTNPNPSTPGGQYTIGLGWVQPAMTSGETAYIFNNVSFDTIRNSVFERGSSTGNWAIFNNTSDCGPSWSLTYICVDTGHSGDIVENNHFITTNGAAIGNGNASTTNLIQTPPVADANASMHFDQYTPPQSYSYSPVLSTNSTIGAGTTIASLCNAISAANAAAGTACASDTIFGAIYDVTNHTAVNGTRSTHSRGGTPDIGAYQYSSSQGDPPNPPTALTAIVN